MSDLHRQHGETVEAYAARMLAIIRILAGRAGIAAGRSVDIDDVIAELEAIGNGDGRALAVIDLRTAVETLQEYSSDDDIRDLVDQILR